MLLLLLLSLSKNCEQYESSTNLTESEGSLHATRNRKFVGYAKFHLGLWERPPERKIEMHYICKPKTEKQASKTTKSDSKRKFLVECNPKKIDIS